jgi:hypothetical protein
MSSTIHCPRSLRSSQTSYHLTTCCFKGFASH